MTPTLEDSGLNQGNAAQSQVNGNTAAQDEDGKSSASSSQVKKPQMKPYDYKLGGPDNDGKEVVKIYTKHKAYVIYRTENAIRIDLDDDDENLKLYAARHYKIGVQLARLYSLLPENLSKTESINRLIGRAMTLNTAGDYDDAIVILKHAESRLVKLMTVQGRLHYTLSAFGLAFFIFLISASRNTGDAKIISQVMVCGALGGLLSIVVGYRNLKIDVDADIVTHCLIGMSRIVIAVIASLFVFFAIKANVIFSFVNKESDSHGLFMFAMVAGFVEMLVPNIMNNLAKDAKVSSDGSAERVQEQSTSLGSKKSRVKRKVRFPQKFKTENS